MRDSLSFWDLSQKNLPLIKKEERFMSTVNDTRSVTVPPPPYLCQWTAHSLVVDVFTIFDDWGSGRMWDTWVNFSYFKLIYVHVRGPLETWSRQYSQVILLFPDRERLLWFSPRDPITSVPVTDTKVGSGGTPKLRWARTEPRVQKHSRKISYILSIRISHTPPTLMETGTIDMKVVVEGRGDIGTSIPCLY